MGYETCSVCVLAEDQLIGLLKKEAFGTCIINCFVLKFIRLNSFQRSWYNVKLLNHSFSLFSRSSDHYPALLFVQETTIIVLEKNTKIMNVWR